MKQGFTLIELLAVIVILAIIALIAVPIVLNIIDDSKESSLLRSAEFYLDAVEYTIADAFLYHGGLEDNAYPITKDGDICKVDLVDNECPMIDNKSNTLKVEVNGDVPTSGMITIKNGNISNVEIVLGKKHITKNSKNEMVYVKFLDEVCELKSGTAKTAGAKYECKVDPNKDAYTFFVLNTRNKAGEIITESSTDKEAVSINLIMAQNINSDGTPTTKAITKANKDSNGGIYNSVAWISKVDYNDDTNYGNYGNNNKGPLTAMNFLSEATKNWTNTNEMLVDTFTDDTGAIYNMKSYNTYARMPYYSEVSNYDSTNRTNAYLYNYLTKSGTIQTNEISGIFSYWTLSSRIGSSTQAWYVLFMGSIDSSTSITTDTGCGVRPVINLKM